MVICLLLCVTWAAEVCAAEQGYRIELQDGSVLQGELLSFDGAVYKVKTGNLGVVTIKASDVRAVSKEAPSPSRGKDYKGMRQQMQSNPETLNMILGLQNDPDVLAVIEDPELLRAVEAGDLESLMANPKFMKLLENPIIKEIGKRGLR